MSPAKHPKGVSKQQAVCAIEKDYNALSHLPFLPVHQEMAENELCGLTGGEITAQIRTGYQAWSSNGRTLPVSPYRKYPLTNSLIQKHKWLVLLVIIVSLVSLLFAKRSLAPQKVEAQATQDMASTSVSVALLVSPIATSTLQVRQTTASSTLEISPLLLRIAQCESGNKANAKNPHSSASGRFQFIRSSWEYYGKQLWGAKWVNKDVFNWDDNTELALYVFKKNGTSDWLASKGCWASLFIN